MSKERPEFDLDRLGLEPGGLDFENRPAKKGDRSENGADELSEGENPAGGGKEKDSSKPKERNLPPKESFSKRLLEAINSGNIEISGDRKDYGYLLDALNTASHNGLLIKVSEGKFAPSRGRQEKESQEIIKALLTRDDTRELIAVADDEKVGKEKREIPEPTGSPRFEVDEKGLSVDKRGEPVSETQIDLAENEKELMHEEQEVRELKYQDTKLERRFESFPPLEQKICRDEFASEKRDSSDLEGVIILREIDKITNLIEEKNKIIDGLRLRVSLDKLKIEKTKSNHSEAEIAARVFDKNTTDAEILSLMPDLSSNLLNRLSRLVDEGAVKPIEDGRFEINTNATQRAQESAKELFDTIKGSIKRVAIENVLKPGSLEFDVSKLSMETSLVELINMIGDEADIDKLMGLLNSGDLIIGPDGELRPKPDSTEAQKDYDGFVKELVERGKERQVKELSEKLYKEALGKDELILAARAEIDEIDNKLNDMYGRYTDTNMLSDYKEKGKIRVKTRLVYYAKHHELFDHFMDDLPKMEELEVRKNVVLGIVEQYRKDIETRSEEIAKSILNIGKLTDFDSLAPDMTLLRNIKEESEVGGMLQRKNSENAKKLSKTLKIKISESSEKSEETEKEAVATTVEGPNELVAEERKAVISEKVTETIDQKFQKLMTRLGVDNEAERNDILAGIKNDSSFSRLIEVYIKQEEIAKKLNLLLGAGGLDKNFGAGTITEQINQIRGLETQKSSYERNLERKLARAVLHYRESERRGRLKGSAKRLFANLASDEGSISLPGSVEEIIDSGRTSVNERLSQAERNYSDAVAVLADGLVSTPDLSVSAGGEARLDEEDDLEIFQNYTQISANSTNIDRLSGLRRRTEKSKRGLGSLMSAFLSILGG